MLIFVIKIIFIKNIFDFLILEKNVNNRGIYIIENNLYLIFYIEEFLGK